MPKSIFIDPKEVRKKGQICFDEIPMNQYSASAAEERRLYSNGELIGIYRDMYIIRAFESMLFHIKKYGQYNGIPFPYDGPLHLSLGQEACAVGQAFLLDKNDFVFGSHRSHGEVLAKGFSAIRKMDEESLLRIMNEYDGGVILRIVSSGQNSVQELAEDFLLYGTLAEILARKTGFQKGFSGSMHAFFPPFGMYPNNAIVGASAPIAVGAALYKKVNQKPGIVISNVGDGALGRGPVWEAMNFAAMDQFHTLWEAPYRGGLPIIFNFFNNFYGMGGQTVGETMAFGQLARVGAGIAPNQLHAERIDGSNPLAIIDAIRRTKNLLLNGEGPVLLDTVTYRLASHSASDHESYRTQEEIETWMQQDPVSAYHRKLTQEGIAEEPELQAISAAIDARLDRIFALCADPAITQPYNQSEEEIIPKTMFSRDRQVSFSDRECDVRIEYRKDRRTEELTERTRGAGSTLNPKSGFIEFRDAVFEAIRDKFYEDPTLIAYGEEVRDWGGPYGVYEGLTEILPYHRFFNSPISESAIVATAVGYGMSGGRAIVELPFCDFLGCAGDEIFNQLPKWQFMSAGHLKMPVVLRIAVGSLYGTQHAQDFSAIVAHIPGLKVIYPATPYDAKGLLTAALNGTDPVVFFEDQRLYNQGEIFHSEGVPQEHYELPIGLPDKKREGTDLTIFTVGAALYPAAAAAEKLETLGCAAELIDARTLVPFDYEPLLESVKKTGRLLLVANEVERGCFLNEIARTVTEAAFEFLHCAPVVYACRNWIAPTGEISQTFYPDADGIIDLIHQRLFPLGCYEPKTKFSIQEALKRAKDGV